MQVVASHLELEEVREVVVALECNSLAFERNLALAEHRLPQQFAIGYDRLVPYRSLEPPQKALVWLADFPVVGISNPPALALFQLALVLQGLILRH